MSDRKQIQFVGTNKNGIGVMSRKTVRIYAVKFGGLREQRYDRDSTVNWIPTEFVIKASDQYGVDRQ